MRYLGGKARQAAHLSKIIASIECAHGAGTEHLFAVGGSLGFGPATLRDAS